MLLSLLLLTLASMWAGLAKSFESLLAARLFMGIGGGPADAVAPDVVGEVFFVHQRGRAMVSATTCFRWPLAKDGKGHLHRISVIRTLCWWNSWGLHRSIQRDSVDPLGQRHPVWRNFRTVSLLSARNSVRPQTSTVIELWLSL